MLSLLEAISTETQARVQPYDLPKPERRTPRLPPLTKSPSTSIVEGAFWGDDAPGVPQIKGGSSETQPDALQGNWSRLALAGIDETTFDRLWSMARRETGWRGIGSRPLSSNSLRDFLDFWKAIRASATEPELALSPNGNLVAEWHRSPRRHLDIEFRGDGRAYYGLFDGKSIHEGIESLPQLATLLLARSSQPVAWRMA